MKLNKLHQIEDAIEKISNATGSPKLEIISALTGIAWDEEEAGEIGEFMIDALADDDSANTQGHRSQPGANAATQKDSE
jgi:hypothetical protein